MAEAADAEAAAAASAADAARADALLERPADAEGDGQRHEFDTNADILLGRKKGGAEAPAPPEEKAMSKRKRRKLEQLAQKRASRELRSQVLEELKTMQLSSEQATLMRASQSTRVSRREQVADARRRLKAGVPLSEEMEKLRRRPRPRVEEGVDAADDAHDESSGSDAERDARVARILAPTHREVMARLAPAPSEVQRAVAPPKPRPAPKAAASAARAGAAEASAAPSKVLEETPAAGAAIAAASPAGPHAQDLQKQDEPAEPMPRLSPQPPPQPAAAQVAQPLQPVRVKRTDAIEEQRSKLPAVMVEQELVETVLSNDVTLVCGDTGCGKSTQVPQFLYEAGLCDGERYRIAVTQPRRVAAISVSQRVGDELNAPGTVGYQVRYDSSHCGPGTRIKFMTDGILLREVQADFLCKNYSAVIIDEAHERGVNCDILIGLLSRAVQRRRQNYDAAVAKGLHKTAPPGEEPPLAPLRLLVMSATLRLCDFTENRQLFPTVPPVIRIDARTYPVTLHFARRTEEDYIKAAHKSVLKIHKQLPPGAVLVFVTGREEVRRLCRMLRNSSAAAAASEQGGEAEEVAGEEDGGPLELLEASDDEGNEFDDALGDPQVESAAVVPSPGGTPTRKKRQNAAAPKRKRSSEAAAEGATEAEAAGAAVQKKVRRKGKRRQPCSVDAAPQEELGAEKAAVPPKGTGKKRKRRGEVGGTSTSENVARKKKKRGVVRGPKDGDAPEAQPCGEGGGNDAGGVAAGGAADEACAEDLPEISFRLDAEEDVMTLNPEGGGEAAAEDAKDAEAKRQKTIRMSKLDRSRTAGGVFKGAGFGEGPLHVLPLFAQLPAREQLAPFAQPPDGARVVVVATNVAETSVTLPNVRYVVDCGHEKRRMYRAASGVSAFRVERISKASSDQRAGRAGRLGPGHTYRLYSAAAYENHFMPFAPIAMLHTPLDPVLLLLASLGVPRLGLFPWPTPPLADGVAAAARRLRAIGAIADAPGAEAKVARVSDRAGIAASVTCTPLGFRLACIPVAPRYARMLLAAVTASERLEAHIVGHACALVAALSVGNLTAWESVVVDDGGDAADASAGEHELLRLQREAAKRLQESREKEAPRWSQLRDDAEGLLWLMGGYAWAVSAGEETAEQFCRENRVNARQISEAHSLMQQLGDLLQRRLSLEDIGIELELPLRPRPPSALQAQRLRECLLEGLVDRVAVACPDVGRGAYACADLGRQTPVFVHSSSNVYRQRPQPQMLVFNEIISSSRPFMRDCIGVDPILLSRRAATGSSSLLRLGEFLPMPAPRYLEEKDEVLAFASPTYAPLDHVLPTVEVNVPSTQIFRYKVFAQAFLEGKVVAGVPPRGAQLLARPSAVLQASNNPRVLGLVGPLFERRVGSRAELLRRWEQEPRFLLEGYLKWLPGAVHDDVRAEWPPAKPASRKQ